MQHTQKVFVACLHMLQHVKQKNWQPSYNYSTSMLRCGTSKDPGNTPLLTPSSRSSDGGSPLGRPSSGPLQRFSGGGCQSGRGPMGPPQPPLWAPPLAPSGGGAQGDSGRCSNCDGGPRPPRIGGRPPRQGPLGPGGRCRKQLRRENVSALLGTRGRICRSSYFRKVRSRGFTYQTNGGHLARPRQRTKDSLRPPRDLLTCNRNSSYKASPTQ